MVSKSGAINLQPQVKGFSSNTSSNILLKQSRRAAVKIVEVTLSTGESFYAAVQETLGHSDKFLPPFPIELFSWATLSSRPRVAYQDI